MGRAEEFLKRQLAVRQHGGVRVPTLVTGGQVQGDKKRQKQKSNQKKHNKCATGGSSGSDVLLGVSPPVRLPKGGKTSGSEVLPNGYIHINTAHKPTLPVKQIITTFLWFVCIAGGIALIGNLMDEHGDSRNATPSSTPEPVCRFVDTAGPSSPSSGGVPESHSTSSSDATSIFNEPHQDNSGSYSASYYTQRDPYPRIEAAEKNYDWANAIDFLRKNMSTYLGADGNGGDHVRLSLLYWNRGEKSEAVSTLEGAINIMKNGQGLGGGCEKLAKALLSKMRSDKLPRMFDHDAITTVLDYVMRPVYARFDNSHRAFMARMDAFMRMAGAQASMYEAQGHWQGKAAEFYARETYREQTGKTFNPDSPPSYGSSERDAWNSAKRIYDIFGD